MNSSCRVPPQRKTPPTVPQTTPCQAINTAFKTIPLHRPPTRTILRVSRRRPISADRSRPTPCRTTISNSSSNSRSSSRKFLLDMPRLRATMHRHPKPPTPLKHTIPPLMLAPGLPNDISHMLGIIHTARPTVPALRLQLPRFMASRQVQTMPQGTLKRLIRHLSLRDLTNRYKVTLSARLQTCKHKLRITISRTISILPTNPTEAAGNRPHTLQAPLKLHILPTRRFPSAPTTRPTIALSTTVIRGRTRRHLL